MSSKSSEFTFHLSSSLFSSNMGIKTMNKLRQARYFLFNFVTSTSPVFDIHLQNVSCCKCRLRLKTREMIVEASSQYIENLQ